MKLCKKVNVEVLLPRFAALKGCLLNLAGFGRFERPEKSTNSSKHSIDASL